MLLLCCFVGCFKHYGISGIFTCLFCLAVSTIVVAIIFSTDFIGGSITTKATETLCSSGWIQDLER